MKKLLVVFDVEGVLLPKWRYIPFEVSRKLGVLKFLKILLIGILYEIGVISLESALRRIYKNFKGYTIEELRHYYERLPLIQDVKETFRRLREKGCKIALISSGLPQLFIKELAKKLDADYAYGIELKTLNGKFNGEIGGTVIKKTGKSLILKKIQKTENLRPENCILVADDRNNLQMFPHVGLKIGFNPDFILSAKADYIVTEKLSEILPIIFKEENKKHEIGLSRNEIIRSIIHIGGLLTIIPCIYLITPHLMAFLILAVAALYTASELFRMQGLNFPPFTSITAKAAVKLELYEFALAPIFYALGIAFSLLIFPQNIAYATIAILTLGDGSASILGKFLGKTAYPFNKAKHIEGTIVGLIFAFLGAAAFLNPIKALVGATVGMLVECFPLPINDNLAVPLISGFTLTVIL